MSYAIEFRVVFENKEGKFWATSQPIDEDQALGHALRLKAGNWDPSTGQEVLAVSIEERQVIEGAPQGWKRYGTFQGRL